MNFKFFLMKKDNYFNNKNILIGGSSNGIGWASAKLFANSGANVTLVSRNKTLLEQRLNQLENNGFQNHHFIVLDFSNPENLHTKFKEFVTKNSLEYDVVVNNTGGPPGGELENASTQDLINAMNLHLISFHKILDVVLTGMKAKKSGRIINIISTSVKQPLNGLGVSNTVRGAVANWAKTLANELGKYNITVNNVLPGATNTGRLKEIINKGGEKISPLEVDNVLMDHPSIEQAVCFGYEDKMLGEDIATAIILKEGINLNEADLKIYAKEKLAKFKIPKKIFFVTEIPKGATGKLQRNVLAKKFGLNN